MKWKSFETGFCVYALGGPLIKLHYTVYPLQIIWIYIWFAKCFVSGKWQYLETHFDDLLLGFVLLFINTLHNISITLQPLCVCVVGSHMMWKWWKWCILNYIRLQSLEVSQNRHHRFFIIFFCIFMVCLCKSTQLSGCQLMHNKNKFMIIFERINCNIILLLLPMHANALPKYLNLVVRCLSHLSFQHTSVKRFVVSTRCFLSSGWYLTHYWQTFVLMENILKSWDERIIGSVFLGFWIIAWQ